MASRITSVIPFLPFTAHEAFVGAATLFYNHRRDLGPRKKVVLNCDDKAEQKLVHQVVANWYEGDAGFRSLETATFEELISEDKNPHIVGDKAFIAKKEMDDTKFQEVRVSTVKIDGELEICARMV